MVDLSTLARYPFLDDSKIYVKNNAISVEDLLEDPLYERARTIGVERLDKTFKERDVGNRSLATESDCIMELLSYPIARMIAVCIGDNYFKRRYALGEASHAYRNLINEPTSFLINVSKEFNLDVKYFEDTNKLSIFFTDYIHNAPTRYKEWKMINREMKNGYIKISHKDLARLIQEALRRRINDELDKMKCDEAVQKIFSSDIRRIQNMVSTHRKNIEAAPVGKLSIEKLPPCMKDMLAAIQAGENVPHMGRFAIVAFLNSLKLSTADILKIFSSAPDYEEDKTRYQVEHITGTISSTSYAPPGCDKMRTYGICPIEKIDELCKKTRHPLSYYKTRWREK
ncbi:MAG: DNA primase large subunit PriL [Candidatus Thermoplasmatota archaeon]|jgi:DNA primase large subunit|nr:DNA primase large subunit PriL [Candidatus Thermoplasmatota archaeon]